MEALALSSSRDILSSDSSKRLSNSASLIRLFSKCPTTSLGDEDPETLRIGNSRAYSSFFRPIPKLEFDLLKRYPKDPKETNESSSECRIQYFHFQELPSQFQKKTFRRTSCHKSSTAEKTVMNEPKPQQCQADFVRFPVSESQAISECALAKKRQFFSKMREKRHVRKLQHVLQIFSISCK